MTRHIGFRRLALSTAIAGLTVLGGCTSPNPEIALISALPCAAPTRVVTDFSDALACMKKLVKHDAHDVVVTSGKLADATGLLKVGAKYMLVTAITKMSGSSNAIHYSEISSAAAMQELDPLQTVDAPVGAQNIQVWRRNYAIEGSFTEVNKKLISDRAGGGVVSDLLQANLQRDQDVGSIALDLHMVDLNGRRVVNNTATRADPDLTDPADWVKMLAKTKS